ncbi:single-stranded DNA-binding protein [Sporosarcina sp. G11-34]|uniref:single-stranded DNA-binding protein n=1 Tax=Sporosarcina sp. G11-34 TaxID=2849605 RepID=UPI0022A99955|nr:single-stranded DNA-binding protein [Sporosarcina sp. G11-34]MCZ2258684.1 single-stranded DNA-binding protein [Sporosarcina sp. G11-34]
MNQVALVGRITKDPILRNISRGRVQTSIIIAVNRNFKNLKGEVEADFILCSVWGKLAENTAKHCGKGSLIGVSGRIQSRTYEREDHSRVYVTEVVADNIRFLSTKRRENEDIYTDSVNSRKEEMIKDSSSEHFHLPKQESTELPII